MARIARSRCAPGALDPGRTYHVTNRAVFGGDLFDSDLDRGVFLAMFARACVRHGAVCHAFCLMTNHFHFVIEDRLGMLPQVMHELEFCYARYFNDTRPYERWGVLFATRFRAEQIDTQAYFEAACAYVFLNPVRTQFPLAAAAEAYRWSSAAMACSNLTPAAWVAGLLAPWGGADGLLAAMRPTKYKSSRDLRRARVEALASGAWLERERVLGDRTPREYARRLAERAARSAGNPGGKDALAAFAAEDEVDDAGALRIEATGDASAPSIPLRSVPASPLVVDPDAPKTSETGRPRFVGLALEETTADAIRDACERFLPSSLLGSAERMGDVVAYVLHRFTSATTNALAASTERTCDALNEAIEWVRGVRGREVGWERALWAVEWSLRWRLRAGPHRA